MVCEVGNAEGNNCPIRIALYLTTGVLIGVDGRLSNGIGI